MDIDYSKITDSPRVIELLKQRIEIENKIKAIDETALIKHEIELLALQKPTNQAKLKDRIDEISELAKDFINEVDKKHPFVSLPEEEDFYISRYRLAEKINLTFNY